MSCRERWRQECLLGRHARLDTNTWYLTMVEARNWLPKPVSRSPEEMYMQCREEGTRAMDGQANRGRRCVIRLALRPTT